MARTYFTLPLLFFVVAVTLATGPQVTAATYKTKAGQSNQVDVTLVEFDLNFDQDLYYIEAIECGSNATCTLPNLSGCAPCDYSDYLGPNCGTTPRSPPGQNCTCSDKNLLCTGVPVPAPDSIVGPAQQLVLDGPALNGSLDYPVGLQAMRLYVPDTFCGAVRIYMVTLEGQTELVMNWYPEFSNRFDSEYSWYTYRTAPNYITICPKQVQSSGTFYLKIQGYGQWQVNAVTLPLPSIDVVPSTPLPAMPSVYTFLESDVPLTLNVTATPGKTNASFYAFSLDGPCPRVFSLSAYLYPYPGADLRGVAVSVSPDPLFYQVTREVLSRPATLTDGILWDLSFPARLTGSFCPADTSQPTGYYVRVTTDGDAGYLTMFLTANKGKMIPVSIPPTKWQANPYEVARILTTAVAMQCGDVFVLPCPDVKARGVNCAKDYYNAIAPLMEPLPIWPPLGIFYDDETTSYDAPSFATAQYNKDHLNWIYVTDLIYDTPDVTLVNSTLLLSALPSCTAQIRPHIVNAQFESSPTPLVGNFKSNAMDCTPQKLAEAKTVINSLISSISPANSDTANRNTSHQLDYWNFRDTWQGCLSLANALFSTNHQTELTNSTFCTDATLRADPCCSNQGLWVYGCCEPRAVELTATSRSPADNVVSAICSNPECVGTYLSDLAAVSNLSCSDALSTQNRMQNLAAMPIADCQDEIYGVNLDGRICMSDDDCWGYRYCSINVDRCDMNRAACIIPNEVKHNMFIQCIINNSDIINIRVLAQRIVAIHGIDPSLTGTTLSDALYLVQDFWGGDCIGDTEFWDTQFHVEIQWNEDCEALCSSELYGWDAFASNFPACANDVSYGAVAGCGDARETQVASNPLSCAQEVSVCNVAPFLINASVCNARPSACVLAWNASFSVSVPGVSAMCNVTYACELANGTVIWMQGTNYSAILQQCQSIGVCTLPCLDDTGRPAACASQSDCITRGGICTDLGVFWHDTGSGPPFTPGACVLPRTATDPCGDTYGGTPWSYMMTQDFGCVLRGYNPRYSSQSLCENSQFQAAYSFKLTPPINGTWMMPARTPTECAAQGCGCKRPQFFDMYLNRNAPAFSPVYHGPQSTPAECEACGGYECTNYYEWIAAQWRGGTLRKLQWRKPTYTPILQWTNAFKPSLFVRDVINAASGAWQRQLLSESQCRFNRQSATLQAVACLCTGRDSKECLSDIDENAPIASGYVCGGLAQIVQAVPHNLQFATDSVVPAGNCVDFTFYSVSRLRFANIAPAQSLSTYFTSVKRGAPGGSYAFLNRRGAPAGEVAGEGLRIVTPSNVTNVHICFASSFIAASEPKNVKYSVPDVAFTDGDFKHLEPLEASLIIGEFWCTTVDTLRNGSYLPVWRSPHWNALKPSSLSSGQVGVLGLAAAAYFIVALAALWVGAMIYSRNSGKVWVLPRFYLCLLLFFASLIRGIYFALLGSEVIRDSTVSDVILVELPTFIWFTATTLICLFWFAAIFQMQAKRVARLFWRLFFIVNAAMYVIFVIFVVVFSQIHDKKTSSCNDRLPISVDRSKRRGAFIAYQIFLAVVALLLSCLFTVGGAMLVCSLRKLSEQTNSNDENSRKMQRGIFVTAMVCAVAFLLHAIFLLILALASPGNPFLVLVLVLLELVPSVFVLYAAIPKETLAAISQTTSERFSSSGNQRSANSGSGSNDGYVLTE